MGYFMHENCLYTWVEDACRVLGHYSSTVLSVGATTAVDTMVSNFQGAGSLKKGGTMVLVEGSRN
jgi:hypothetical protein